MTKLMGLGSGSNTCIDNYQGLQKVASNNTGNLLFNYAIEKICQLDGTDIRWSTPAEDINKDGHGLILPMANNIGKHTDLSVSGPKLNGVNVPITVMGLGAQFTLAEDFDDAFDKVPEGTKHWLLDLCSRSIHPNVSVRGQLTHKVFEKLGVGNKALSLGCPSHFISNNKTLGASLASQAERLDANACLFIGITAGNTGVSNLSKLERYLINLINKYDGRYIVQHAKDLICLSQCWWQEITPSEEEKVRHLFFPDDTVAQMRAWFKRKASTYISIPQWYSDVSKCDFVIGTRIHGCQIAIQAGVPALCLHIDSRTKELCETMHIPTIHAHAFQKEPHIETILSTLKRWDWTAYDKNRVRLAAETRDFLTVNAIKPTAHLLELAK